MRRSLAVVILAVATALTCMGMASAHSPSSAGKLPGVGHMQVVQGFGVTIRWVKRAREAGAADYVAGRRHVFLLVDVVIARHGSHDSYYADPQDFHIETSSGDVLDSEQFGMEHELKARHVYRKPVEGVVGFEVPANDRHLRLLWQPTFDSNPDAQAEWSLPATSATVQYFQ